MRSRRASCSRLLRLGGTLFLFLGFIISDLIDPKNNVRLSAGKYLFCKLNMGIVLFKVESLFALNCLHKTVLPHLSQCSSSSLLGMFLKVGLHMLREPD